MFSKLLVNCSLALLFSLIFFLPNNSYAFSNKFLTSPFLSEQRLMQGWFYDFGNRSHQGVDYYTTVGTPIVATADGVLNSYFQPGRNFVYGKYVVLTHDNGYKSLFAHLSEFQAAEMRYLRGSKIGKTGITGTDNPHLHFELLSPVSSGAGANRGFGWRVDPYDIYKTNLHYPGGIRYAGLGSNHYWKFDYPAIHKPPLPAPILSGEVEQRRAKLSWNTLSTEGFDRLEVYRSEIKGGTRSLENRITVSVIKNSAESSFWDPKELTIKKEYFYSIGIFKKDGRSAISEEVALARNFEIINITNSSHNQGIPRVQGSYVVWRDYRREQNPFPQNTTLFYYDILEGRLKTAKIGSLMNRLEGPHYPDVYGDWICYEARTSKWSDVEIYCHSIKGGYDIPITTNFDHDSGPRISSEGYIVWTKETDGGRDIYALYLKDSRGEYLVTDAPFNQSQPSIYGSVVVWKDTRIRNRTDIYMKDLAGGEEVHLAQNTGGGPVEIFGDYITWVNKGVVYLMNVKTKEQEIVYQGDARDAEINGSKVAYFKFEEGLRDDRGRMLGNIYIYDILSKSHTKIEKPLFIVPRMDICESVLVFSAPGPEESHETNGDIFLVYL